MNSTRKYNYFFNIISIIFFSAIPFSRSAICQNPDSLHIIELFLKSQELSNKDSLGKALEFAEKANNLSIEVYDREHSKAINEMGRVFFRMGDMRGASEKMKKALKIEEDNGYPDGQFRIKLLSNLAVISQNSGNISDALNYYNQALELMNQTSEVNIVTKFGLLYNLATLSEYTGDYDQAEYYLEQCSKIRQQSDEIPAENVIGLLNGIGVLKIKKGDFLNAEKVLLEAEYLSKKSPVSLSLLGFVYQTMSDAYLGMFKFDKALDYNQKSLEIRIALYGYAHMNTVSSISQKGIIYQYLNKYADAKREHLNALKIATKILGGKNEYLAIPLINLGIDYKGLNDLDSSLICLNKALEIRGSIYGYDSPRTAEVYFNLGDLHYTEKNYNASFESYQKATKILKDQLGHVHPSVAQGYSNIAKVRLTQEEFESALNYVDTAIMSTGYQLGMLKENVPHPTYALFCVQLKGQALYELYLVKKQKGLLNEALEYFDEALDFVPIQRGELSNSPSSVNFSDVTKPVYEKGIQLNHLVSGNNSNKAHKAFTYAEDSKSFMLFQSLQSSDALHYANIPDSLLTREYDLKIDITYHEKKKQEKLDKGHAESDTTILAVSSKLFDLRREYEALIERFERDYHDYHDLKYNLSTITVEEVQQQLLRPKEALLEYFVGDSSIFIFVVKPDDYQVVEVKKDFPLEAWVDTLRHNIYQNQSTYSESYVQAATDLYDKLVKPVAGLLPERLIVIPDGVLGYVPFDALLTGRPKDLKRPDRYDYLLKKHQISYCYSATLLKKMRERQHRHAPTKEFVAFSPYYTGSVQELEYLQPFQFSPDSLYAGLRSWTPSMADELQASAAEVKTVTKKIGGDAFYGSEATEARFDSIAGQYRIVHLATHGIADNRVGDYSFLAFYILPDSTENELLYVRDLYNLELNADMVVLSACETGLGELQRGEGIISLARAFAYAGAKSIVNTLWKVSDQSTSELMVLFYGYLKDGKEKDEALRLAKLAYIKQHGKRAMPFFWAGVIPVGDMGRVW